MPDGYVALSIAALTVNPVLVLVWPINSTIACRVTSGLPRQFCVMNENILCSILFHLLVPGGKMSNCHFQPGVVR